MLKRLSVFIIILSLITVLQAGDDEFNTNRLPIGNPLTKYDFCSVKKDSILDCKSNTNISLENLIQNLKNHRIILIGESHTNDSHHQVQLQILKGLAESGEDVCLALEMFNPSQNEVLNQYTSGKMSEEEFLNHSNYFNTWGHNYRYYKPIFDFASKNRIKMYGVNIDHKFASKIGRGGIQSLTPEELQQLPQIDTTDVEHRYFVKAVMEGMDATSPKQFEKIYQAQSLWDTAMGEGAIAVARENPDSKILVLAGSGHVAYNLGISRIIRKRSDIPFVSLVSIDIPDTVKESMMMKVKKSLKKKKETPEPSVKKQTNKMPMSMMPGSGSNAVPHKIVARSLADFLWGLPEEKQEKYPTLGFSVNDKTKTGFEIKMVYPESIAEQQGLERGDVIQSIDKHTFENKVELKKYLGLKNWKNTISMDVLRKGENVQLNFIIAKEEEK